MIPTIKTNILEEDELECLVGVVSPQNTIISDIMYSLQLSDAISECHCNDSSSLKHVAFQYLMKDFEQDALTPLIPKSKMKSDHSFNHTVIAYMLCPRAQLDEFDEDPQQD